MSTRTTLSCLALIVALTACDDGAAPAGDPPTDARVADAGPLDGSPLDAEPPDARPDRGIDDAGPLDARSVDAEIPDAAPVDPTEAVFAADHLTIVSLEIDPADWDALRSQSRGGLDTRGADCLDAPFESPYTWFHARLTVDGQTYADVGVRKKGFFGSVSASRPSLKIRVDKYVADQEHAGLSRITLNNQRQDPSLIRSCLAYAVFARAGVPTPRCNFAQLFVNGRDMGVFAHVESLRKPWLRRHFSDDEGHLYEGTLSDFRPEYRGTIEQKTDEEVPYTAPIDRIVEAVGHPDETLIEALGGAIDLENFFAFWAAEVLTTHWDGYSGNTNNFWFYDDPTSGRVHFIPWGPDATFTRPRLLFEGIIGPWSVMATGIITRRLYAHPEGRARYLAAVERLLDTVWDPAWMRGLVDTWVGTFEGALPAEVREAHAAAVAEVVDFVQDQAVRMRREIASPAEWDVPLRDSLCTTPVGHLEATLETTFGSWPAQDTFRTGSGTMSGTLWDEALEVTAVGGAIGPVQGGRIAIIQPVRTTDDVILFVYLALDPAQIRPGEVAITPESGCSLNVFDGREAFPIAECPEGRLVFEAASREAAAPVRARYEITLWGQR